MQPAMLPGHPGSPSINPQTSLEQGLALGKTINPDVFSKEPGVQENMWCILRLPFRSQSCDMLRSYSSAQEWGSAPGLQFSTVCKSVQIRWAGILWRYVKIYVCIFHTKQYLVLELLLSVGRAASGIRYNLIQSSG